MSAVSAAVSPYCIQVGGHWQAVWMTQFDADRTTNFPYEGKITGTTLAEPNWCSQHVRPLPQTGGADWTVIVALLGGLIAYVVMQRRRP